MAITDELFGLTNILSPLFRNRQEDNFDPTLRMNQLYTPETMAMDQLNQHIQAMPARREPGMLRKVIASVAGLGGPNAAEQQERIMYGDYGRQMADWQQKLNPLVQMANFERQGNINERTLANSILTQERGFRSLERQVARDKTLEEQGNKRISQADRRIAQADARVAIAKDVAKGGQLVFQADGKAHMLYKDGTTKPVDLDLFDPAERMALQQEYALERIQENAENRPGNRDRIRTEVIDDPDNPGKRILVTINLDTNEVKRATMGTAGGGKTNAITPTTRTEEPQINKDRKVTAEALRIRAQDPKLGRYIKIKNGRFEGITTPGMVFGPSELEYKDLYKRIYGTEPTEIPKATNVAPSQAGRVKVISPEGKQGSIPAEQLDEAIKQGYRRVQ